MVVVVVSNGCVVVEVIAVVVLLLLSLLPLSHLLSLLTRCCLLCVCVCAGEFFPVARTRAKAVIQLGAH